MTNAKMLKHNLFFLLFFLSVFLSFCSFISYLLSIHAGCQKTNLFFTGLCNKIVSHLSLSPSEAVLKNVRSFLLLYSVQYHQERH